MSERNSILGGLVKNCLLKRAAALVDWAVRNRGTELQELGVRGEIQQRARLRSCSPIADFASRVRRSFLFIERVVSTGHTALSLVGRTYTVIFIFFGGSRLWHRGDKGHTIWGRGW